jgi:cytochrome c oxidase subunit 2
MFLRKAPGPFWRRVWVPLIVAILVAGCGTEFPQSTLFPKGDFAQLVDDLFQTTLKWAVVVFVLVESVLILALVRFRGRPGDPRPRQSHGNTLIEMVWTIIPAAILAFIAVPTVRTIFRSAELPAGALEIEVIGHQWWWEFRYPAEQVVTANEMHVPAGRTVLMKIRSADVLHSFWVPQFAAKRDAFQGRYTTLFFTTDSLGAFTGQCAEFCGLQHARMGSLVVVQTPEEFAAWVTQQREGSPLVDGGTLSPADSAAPAADSVEIRGKAAFLSGGCVGCHAMAGTPTAGLLNLPGPNLSHFGGRRRIAAGTLSNTPDELARWLRDPDAVKEGSLMKLPRSLTEDEIRDLVSYLRAHQ